MPHVKTVQLCCSSENAICSRHLGRQNDGKIRELSRMERTWETPRKSTENAHTNHHRCYENNRYRHCSHPCQSPPHPIPAPMPVFQSVRPHVHITRTESYIQRNMEHGSTTQTTQIPPPSPSSTLPNPPEKHRRNQGKEPPFLATLTPDTLLLTCSYRSPAQH